MTSEVLLSDLEEREAFSAINAEWFGAVLHTGTVDLGIRESTYIGLKAESNFLYAYPYVRIRSKKEGLVDNLSGWYGNASKNKGEWMTRQGQLFRLLRLSQKYCPSKKGMIQTILNYAAISDSVDVQKFLRLMKNVDLRRDMSTLEEYRELVHLSPKFVAGVLDTLSIDDQYGLSVESTFYNLLKALNEEYLGSLCCIRPAGKAVVIKGREYILRKDSWLWTVGKEDASRMIARVGNYLQVKGCLRDRFSI